MQHDGPKRRTTQMGIGQSGTRPRADDGPDAASDEKQNVLCPPPSAPPSPKTRTSSDEHATVAFGEEVASALRHTVRERAASATDEVDEIAKREIARRDSVREFMAAAAATRARTESAAVRSPAPPESAPPSRRAPYGESAPPSAGPRSAPGGAKPERPALRVDEVGTAAVRLASRAPHDATPRVLVDRRTLASAPIDHREAFLLSLMDGRLTVAGLVDVSGMREGEVLAALQRLARLGLVAV